jgi:hypothetical protein
MVIFLNSNNHSRLSQRAPANMGCWASSATASAAPPSSRGNDKYAVEAEPDDAPPSAAPKAGGQYTDLGQFAVDTSEPLRPSGPQIDDAGAAALHRYAQELHGAKPVAGGKRPKQSTVVVPQAATMQAGMLRGDSDDDDGL